MVKIMSFSFFFQVVCVKIHSKLNLKFRIKIQIAILFKIFDVQANLPETSPYFFSAQMAVLIIFFHVFILLGMHNFNRKKEIRYVVFNHWLFLLLFKFLQVTMHSKLTLKIRIRTQIAVYCLSNLPETCPFLSAQMALLSIFFVQRTQDV